MSSKLSKIIYRNLHTLFLKKFSQFHGESELKPDGRGQIYWPCFREMIKSEEDYGRGY